MAAPTTVTRDACGTAGQTKLHSLGIDENSTSPPTIVANVVLPPVAQGHYSRQLGTWTQMRSNDSERNTLCIHTP